MFRNRMYPWGSVLLWMHYTKWPACLTKALLFYFSDLIRCSFLVTVAFFPVFHDCSMFDIFSWVISPASCILSFHLKSCHKSLRYGSFHTDVCAFRKRSGRCSSLMKLGTVLSSENADCSMPYMHFPHCIVKVSFVNCSLHCTENPEGKLIWKCVRDFPLQTEKRAPSVCCFNTFKTLGDVDKPHVFIGWICYRCLASC